MIGNCECCDRKNVPITKVNLAGEPAACFICQGDTNPDPYGEFPISQAARCPYCGLQRHAPTCIITGIYELMSSNAQLRQELRDSARFLPMETAPKDEPILLKMIGYADVGSWFEVDGKPGWWVCHAIPVEPIGWSKIPGG